MSSARRLRKASVRRIGEGGFNPPDPTKPLAESVAAWVAGIAKWTAIESHRARARHHRLFARGPTRENPIDTDAVRVPGPAEVFDSQEELAAVERMKMSPTRREVVRLTATHLKRARKAWAKALSR